MEWHVKKAPLPLLFLFTVSLSGQTPDLLTEPIENYSLYANSFIDALLKISAQFQLPLGVEWVKTADTMKAVRLSRSNTTAADVIQAMVSMNAGYDWRMEDGVVHFSIGIWRTTVFPNRLWRYDRS